MSRINFRLTKHGQVVPYGDDYVLLLVLCNCGGETHWGMQMVVPNEVWEVIKHHDFSTMSGGEVLEMLTSHSVVEFIAHPFFNTVQEQAELVAAAKILKTVDDRSRWN